MTCGIYKIENLINGKIYIGQSKHIEKRFQQHCICSSKSDLSSDIRKFGKDNFSFEILEECCESDLLQKESDYILRFNSLVPNGYNKAVFFGENLNLFFTNGFDTIRCVINDLKFSDLTIKEISEKYDMDLSFVYMINRGDNHRIDSEVYPLREVADMSKVSHFCKMCGCEIHTKSTFCVSCASVNQRRVERPRKEELILLIKTKTFVEIGKLYGVSDNAVRKWCKYYDLPFRKKDIKKYNVI